MTEDIVNIATLVIGHKVILAKQYNNPIQTANRFNIGRDRIGTLTKQYLDSEVVYVKWDDNKEIDYLMHELAYYYGLSTEDLLLQLDKLEEKMKK